MTKRVRRLALSLLAVAGVLSAGGSVARAAVARAGAGSEHRALVQQSAEVPAGTSVTGAVAAGAPIHVTLALAPSDPQALSSYAQQVSDPSSPLYRHYLTVGQFAQRFGADAAQVASVRSALSQAGLSVGSVASDGLSLSASGTAAQIEDAFATRLERVTLPDGSGAYADVGNPTLPAAAADAVQAVAGLDTLPAAAPQDLRRAIRSRPNTSAGSSTTSAAGPSSCIAEQHAGGYTAAEIGSAYGMDGQWSAGNLGAGATVGLAELEPYSATDVAKFQACDGTTATVSNVTIGQGASCYTVQGYDSECGIEDVLDIEDIAGLVPDATIDVYEAPNTDKGVLNLYQKMVTADVPVISTSWGLCEANADSTDSSFLATENTWFEEAAVQGEAVFAAAGDAGADDCGTGVRAVDDPASQPYVTGVGGTTMTSSAPGAAQTVWNDSSSAGGGAGGGGVSREWAQPGYQSGFAIPQNAIRCSTAPGGALGSTSCREVPDVSADADPNTGYDIYWNGGWLVIGGTSAAAPTWASLAALADSSTACTTNGVHVGFANAVLYGLPSSDFNDVTVGNNTVGAVAGYNARKGYDMASGLGTPDGASLMPALCDPPKTLTAPTTTTTSTSTTTTTTTTPTQTTTAPSAPAPVQPTPAPVQTTTVTTTTPTTTTTTPGSGTRAPVVRFIARPRHRTVRRGHRVRIILRARDRAGLRLRYSARRLPAGLRIGRRTGVISGRPRRLGRRVSSITARDARGDAETIVIRWTIRRR